MAELKYYGPEHWDGLPVQPPSGVWLKRYAKLVRPIQWSIYALAAVAFAQAAWRPLVWLLVVVAPAVFGLLLTGIAMACLAMPAYYREKRLGYTTWSLGRFFQPLTPEADPPPEDLRKAGSGSGP